MEDCGNFYVYHFEQNSKEWHTLRNQKLTMSNAAAAIGESPYESPDELADYLTGKKEKVFSDRARALMTLGSLEEGAMREWYQEKYPKRKVTEIGFAVPKWCDKIGCSPDGLVDDDGIIEIKHVVNFNYATLSYYNDKKGKKLIDAIPKTHYAQIQGNLGILERKWCDYIVRRFNGPVLCIRIPFDEKFWLEVQKPKMLAFVEQNLK